MICAVITDASVGSCRRTDALRLDQVLVLFIGLLAGCEPRFQPPEVPDTLADDLTAALEQIRSAALLESESARAIGNLGIAYEVNGLEELAVPCYIEAHRLDPTDETWPYFLALNVGLKDREAGSAGSMWRSG